MLFSHARRVRPFRLEPQNPPVHLAGRRRAPGKAQAGPQTSPAQHTERIGILEAARDHRKLRHRMQRGHHLARAKRGTRLALPLDQELHRAPKGGICMVVHTDLKEVTHGSAVLSKQTPRRDPALNGGLEHFGELSAGG